MTWVIYTLKNPRTNEVRYVGWTSRDPVKRLKEHLSDAVNRTAPTYRDRWILSLLSIGLLPVMDVIETGCGDGYAASECQWISFYRTTAARLTNTTDGGDGMVGWGTPEQRRARAQKINDNQTPEQKKARAKKGAAKITPEQRSATIKAYIAGLTPEQLSKRMEKLRAAMSLEERREQLKRLGESLTHEQRSANAKKGEAGLTPQQILERAARSRRTGLNLKINIADRMAGLTREERSALGRRAMSVRMAGTTPEERTASSKKAWETRRRNASIPKL